MTDWSSWMTLVYEDLRKAEEELRLIHMGEAHKQVARTHIEDAMLDLKLLKGWCDG